MPHDALADQLLEYDTDPLGFVHDAFPWGEEGTELSRHEGPRRWQANILTEIGEHLSNPATRFTPLRIAVASGHGIGKSALVGMITNWAMSTCAETRMVVTANTDGQLRTKTWPEIAKWARLAVNADWWTVPATSMYAKAHEKSWRADAIPWSENNTEGFAGLHNEGKRIVVIFDEASGIADKIWEVTEGALTDENTEIIWIAFGNPTQPTGRFHDCFGKHRHLWKRHQIDSRTVEGVNKAYLDEAVATHGEDSDFVRMRIRGVFPRAGVNQFIGTDIIEAAQKRHAFTDPGSPFIIGVDIARYGDDQSVLRARKGRDGRPIKPIKWRNMSTVYSAGRIADAIDVLKPDAVFIDGGGVGGGVVDILKSRNYKVTEINFGATAKDEKKYVNKRAEMYGLAKEWLDTGQIDDDQQLADDLVGPLYFYDKDGRIQLESKKDMKERGLPSPDDADAFVLTFAAPVQRTDMATSRIGRPRATTTGYPVLD